MSWLKRKAKDVAFPESFTDRDVIQEIVEGLKYVVAVDESLAISYEEVIDTIAQFDDEVLKEVIRRLKRDLGNIILPHLPPRY